MNLPRGWTTTPAGEVSDADIASHNLLVVRGLCVDGIFKNDANGRRIVKIWKDKEKRRR